VNPLDWPFLITMLLLAAVVVALGALNWRALRAVLRPGGALGDGPPRKRARYAWLLSVTAFFSGPLAPVLGVVVMLVGWWARRSVASSTVNDPHDRAAATAAALNGLALALLGAWIMVAVWLADPGR
jgi:hypothetical protein